MTGAAEQSVGGGLITVGSCACGSCGVCHMHRAEVGVGGVDTGHVGCSHVHQGEAGGGGADTRGNEGGTRTAVVREGSGGAGVTASQSRSSSS